MTNEERQQHINTLNRMLNHHSPYSGSDSDAAVAAGIAALEREGQTEAQQPLPALDLEPVRRLIVKIGNRPSGKSSLEHLADCGAALSANLPALKTLLAEREASKLDFNRASNKMHALLAEVERLREENAKLKEKYQKLDDYIEGCLT